MRPTILILSSPGRNRLEHWRHLHALRPHYRFVCCSIGGCQGWEERFADRVVVVPCATPDRAAAAILDELAGTGEIAAVLCLSEVYVPVQACLCERLGLPGPDSRMAEIGRNKSVMRRFLQSLGAPVPNHFLYEGGRPAIPDGIRFPVVAKPVIGSSSAFVRVFATAQELAAELPRVQAEASSTFATDVLFASVEKGSGLLPFMVEDQILGEVCFETSLPYRSGEISVESVAAGGEVWILAIHDAPVPSDGPYFEKVVNSTPTRLPRRLADEAGAIVRRIHSALGPGAYVLHTEMKTRREGLQVLEFGIRIGGSSLYRSVKLSTGVDLIDFMVEVGLGHTPAVAPRTPATPTLIQYLSPATEGRITAIGGIATLEELPSLVAYRFYDDIGSVARRPPWKAHSSAYAAFQGPDFAVLEAESQAAVSAVQFTVEPIA